MTIANIPIVDLARQFNKFENELVEIFLRVGRSGIYVQGPELLAFEKHFAEYCGVPFAIGVGNATDGLAIALKAMEIRPGDEVITAANSFIASAGAIAEVGATPVFADIREDLNIDPESVSRLITSRTKAIMPVHLTGRPADMDPLLKIAQDNDLWVIEDAAQAVGAKYKGKRTGALGDIAVFSLHPLKNLHVYGDGGIITTKSPELQLACQKIRNHGLIDRDTCLSWGRNSRLDELQAAIANFKLNHIDELNDRFRLIAARYTNELSSYVGVPQACKNCANGQCGRENLCVFHNYVILPDDRNALMNHLAKRGIATKIRYPRLLNEQPAYGNPELALEQTPIASRINARILSLPIFPEMTDAEVSIVIDAVKEFYSK